MKEVFEQNLPLLTKLFGEQNVKFRLNRLKEIFQSTESTWANNIERFKDKPVKYILIGEAPPWSETGIPRYFYNQIESKLHKSIWNTIFPLLSVPKDCKNSYDMLADEGFLLIDTLPYSMDYSGKRQKTAYSDLLYNSVNWWTKKLENENLILAKNIKLAFAFRINGLKIIQSLNYKLELRNGQIITLNENIIAADGSGYTSPQKLRTIFFELS